MAVGVFSKKGEYDSLFLSNYLDVYIKDAVKRVPGVGDVVVFGERKYSMRLWVDPDRLAARGLTANDVVQALREQNVQVAAGSLGPGAGAVGADVSAERPRARPADRGLRVREHHPQERPRRLARPPQGRRPRRARRGNLCRQSALPGRRGGRLRRHAAPERQLARRRTRGDGGARSPRGRRSRRACATWSPSTPPTSSKRRSRRC